MTEEHSHTEEPAVYGVMAEFDDPDSILHAAEQVYAAGYRKIDAYTPFPVHGLAEAMGVKRTWLPAIVLAAGVSGALGGFAMQAFARVVHYPFIVGGREQLSWPGFIPITFECGILCAAFAAVFGMIIMNGLPQPYHPVFNASNFDRASTDRFFLCVEAQDARFDAGALEKLLSKLGALETQLVHE